MAKNTGSGYRQGSVNNRTQCTNTKTGLNVKRDCSTGQFMDVKTSGGKFKGVAQEVDGRRTK